MQNSTAKRVSYLDSNSYETLNELTNKTKNIWIVLHGLGYLSRYFLKPFKALNADENYIVAPQAPSKYYLNDEYKHVGASWLTKEDTQNEIPNVLNYLDAVLENENLPNDKRLLLFGFSQGVSIVMRWIAHRKLTCNQIILYAGGIPNELIKEDFKHLDFNSTLIQIVYGDKDHFLTDERLKTEFEKKDLLFGEKAKVIRFEGGHEIKPALLTQLLPG